MKIISGGQTGVDRGALDAARDLGIPHGGWCPLGRLAEDGPIPDDYRLQETDTTEYRVRTERNVVESDATLVVCRGQPSGGTELTVRLAERYGRPCLIVDLGDPLPVQQVRFWLRSNRVEVLNVAGPRESQSPGIAARARQYVVSVFAIGEELHGTTGGANDE